MILFAPLLWIVLAQGPATPLSGTVIGPDGKPVAGADVLLAGMPVYDPPILARARSDAEGRFRLDRPAGLASQTRFIAPILWAVKPGYRLAFIRFSGPMPGADKPVRIALRPPGKAEVRVEGPDGVPVAGARVRVQWLGRVATYVPDEVGELIEATTDRDGLAVLDAGSNEEVTYVDVHSRAFGIQGRPFFPVTSKPKHVWLRPAAALRGRLVADDRAMVKGWRVSAYTRTGDRTSHDPATTGFAMGTTDDEGRFSFPAIAPGGLQLELKPPRDLPVLPDLPTALAVVEGRENAFDIPLRKPATVTGVVRERGTGRPIPGVELYFFPLRGSKTISGKTDAQGRYTFLSLPGEMRISVFSTPPTHVLAPGQHWKDFTVPPGAGRIELEPREAIPAAPPLRFVVRDETGKPAAHAAVTGQSASRYMPDATDNDGEFTVPGLPPGGEVTIEVRQGERRTDGPVKVVAGGTDPVPVTIVPGLVLAMAGRVLGPGGTPIADALVTAKFRETPRNGRFAIPQAVRFDDGTDVRTASDGTFQTPKEIYRKDREFRVEATADGFLSNQTDWISSPGGDRLRMPDLVLRRSPTLRFVSGRVVDRDGKAIAGASVFQSGDAPRRTRITTGGDGRFRLAGVPSSTAFVFAEKAGFRFGGTIVGPADSRLDIRLARVDEPPPSTPKPVPPLMSRADERAMARELLGPLLVGARAHSLGNSGASVIPTLARVDPDRVLAMLENRVVTQPAGVLYQVALAQLEDDRPAAIATIEADSEPASRAEGFLSLADATPDAERARRVELLDRALAEARRLADRANRLRILGQVADRWLGLDDLDRATPILREGQAIAASLPRDQYIPGLEEFAEALAVIDLPAARAIFERKSMTNASPTDPASIQRHLGEAAVRLAAIDPAAAERLVPRVVPNFYDDARASYVLRICRRMARVDVSRARKILDTIDEPSGPASVPRPTLRPEGLGLMASERAATDPAGARELLDEAFAELRKVGSEDRGVGPPSGSNTMAALLPVVERLEPNRLEERLWLVAACRAPLAEQPDIYAVQARIILAMLVSRYDRAMAAATIGPALERLTDLLADTSGISFNVYNNARAIRALATYDPRALVALIQDLPDSARKVPEKAEAWNAASLDAQLRLAAAEMLGLPLDERRWKVLGGNQRTWPFRRDD